MRTKEYDFSLIHKDTLTCSSPVGGGNSHSSWLLSTIKIERKRKKEEERVDVYTITVINNHGESDEEEEEEEVCKAAWVVCGVFCWRST